MKKALLCIFCVIVSSIYCTANDRILRPELVIAIENLDVNEVKSLLNKGVSPKGSYENNENLSAIGLVIFACRTEVDEKKAVAIIQSLLEKGAKPLPYDSEIVYIAIARNKGTIIETLLDWNYIHPEDTCAGKRLIEVAEENDATNVIRILIEHGATPVSSSSSAQLRLIAAAGDHDVTKMTEAIQDGAYVNSVKNGQLPLIEASRNFFNFEEAYLAIKFLLNLGADPNKEAETGYSGMKGCAFHVAMFSTTLIFSDDAPEKIEKVVKLFLENGALVAKKNADGSTPLHYATKWGNLIAAKTLIEAGATIMPKDHNNRTPLDYAESAEMIKLLREYGARE